MVAELRSAAERARGAGGRDRPDARAGGDEPGARSSTAPAGSTPTSTRCGTCSSRSSTPCSTSTGGRAGAGLAQASAARSPAPRPARCSPSWPARCSASTTSRPSGTPAAAARRAQHRAGRARAGVDPDDFRLWVLPARGDPPGAVHRRAVAARPHGRLGARALAADLAPDPERARRQAAAAGPQPARGAAQRRRRPGRPVRHARAARAQIAGSPRSCRCSRGTPTSSWTTWARRSSRRSPTIRARFQQRRNGRRRRRPAAAPAARPRGQDAPVPRRRGASSARSPTRSASTASTRVWTSPETLPLPAEIEQPDGLGPPRPRLTGPAPAPAVSPCRPTRASPSGSPCAALADAAPRRRWSSSPAAAAPTRWRSPPRPPSRRPGGGCGPGAVVVDHGLQAGLRPTSPPRRPRRVATLGLDPVEVVRGRRCARPARRPEAAARDARYDALEDAAAAPRRRRGAARAHPRRPGRAGAARPRPRLRRPVPGRDAAPPAAASRARCSASRGQTTARPAPAEGLDPWHDPHNDDPAFRRVRARRAAGRRSSATSARASPPPSPASADLLRDGRRPARRGSPARPGAALGDRAARRRGARRRCRGRSARGSGGCSPSRRACRPARCARRARRRARRAGRPRWRGQGPVDLPGGLQATGVTGGAGADRRRASGSIGLSAALPRPGPPDRPHVRRSRGRRPHGRRPRARAHHRGGDPRQARRARRAEIWTDYEGKDLLLVGILKGAVMVMADLMRALPGTAPMDWIADLLLRLGHQVLRCGADPQGPRHRHHRQARPDRRGHHRLGPDPVAG